MLFRSRKSEAERAAARWEAEIEAGCGKRLNTTWEEFRDRVEKEKLAGLAERSAGAYATVLNAVEEKLNPARLSSLNASAVSKFAAALRDGGIAESTIKSYLTHLLAAMNWAVGVGLLREAPKMPKTKPAKKDKLMRGRPLVAEEFERMLAKVAKVRPHDVAAWQFYLKGLWWSGLRLSESLELSWDQDAPFCVDFSGHRPMFRIYAESQKSRRDQLLPMAPEFAELLGTVPVEQRHGRVFVLHPKRDKRGERGIKLANSVGRVVSQIGEAAGVITDAVEGRHATAHDLRRSFGTRWSRRVRPEVLQKMMRHRDIKTTLDYYVRQTTDEIASEIWASVNRNVNPCEIRHQPSAEEKAATHYGEGPLAGVADGN